MALGFQPSESECQQCVDTRKINGSSTQLFKAVTVWVKKPHVANRRLCGSKIVAVEQCQDIESVATVLDTLCEEHLKGQSCNVSERIEDLNAEVGPFTIILRELVPKSQHFPKLMESVVFDHSKKEIIFSPVNKQCGYIDATDEIVYSIKFKEGSSDEDENEVELQWSCDHEETQTVRRQVTGKWLSSVLLDKLVNWSNIKDLSTKITSLKLVSVNKYKDKYIRLKNAYGYDLVKNWTERTDPQKFVYEDVAIAAYLLLLWEEDYEKKHLTKKQSFVDLGCGNGLLVYILVKEGYKGCGIDLRRRKIWDTFGPDVDLREGAIKPSSENLFPEYDWLIGNHSDELTPWIPVIAARSSYSCNFFVLPCCHHDFVGKFTQNEKNMSMYSSYLNYVGKIVENCGFSSECDSLRIPSTKRTCYIGRKRTYAPNGESEAEEKRENFISQRLAYIHKLGDAREKKNSSKEAEQDLVFKTDKPGDDSASHQATNSQIVRSFKEPHLSPMPPVSPSANLFTLTSLDVYREGSGLSSLDSGLSSLDSGLSSLDSGLGSLDKTQFKPSTAMAMPSSQCSPSISPCKGPEDHASAGGFLTDSAISRPMGFEDATSSKSRSNLKRESQTSLKSPSDVEGDLTSANKKSKIMLLAIEHSQKDWAVSFQVRKEQGPRNCQSVPADIKRTIVELVFKMVMSAAETLEPVTLEDGRTWNRGGAVPLGKAVDQMDRDILGKLKSECGGLQTLLRNHSHVFEVTQGSVKLRNFLDSNRWKGRNPQKSRGKTRDTLKTKECWFLSHHPDGCPLPSEKCLYAHGKAELRQPQQAF